MARYQIKIKYDGTDFFGYQRQKDTRTVQGEFEKALKQIGWRGKSVLAAGRTDQGVHASGQIVAFDLDWGHSISDLQNALNANLPADVAVVNVNATRDDFHPRYDAVSRHYRYQILCAPVRDPLRERYAWRIWPQLNIDRLHDAAKRLVGTHDFKGFGTPPKPGGPTIRTVFSTAWKKDGETLYFEVIANAFLYHMVRRMVAIQIDIGAGLSEVADITKYLDQEDSAMLQGLAPPNGLELVEVNYPAEDEEKLEKN
jgi:tRNA pseudouridine38-40 synthase